MIVGRCRNFPGCVLRAAGSFVTFADPLTSLEVLKCGHGRFCIHLKLFYKIGLMKSLMMNANMTNWAVVSSSIEYKCGFFERGSSMNHFACKKKQNNLQSN